MAKSTDLGIAAEALVADWLIEQGWAIECRRWRCRWGELDLVATQMQPISTIAFVEVKARSRGNWDADGLLAITPQKQAKLIQTAQLFLADRPQWAECVCRFDVALVTVRSSQLHLQQYLPNAFDLG